MRGWVLAAVLLLPAAAHAQATPEAESSATVHFRPGHGMRVRSDDDRFELRIGTRGQLRAAVEVPTGGDAALGAEVRRARLNLSGHIFGVENRFRFQIAFSPDDLGIVDGRVTFSPLLDYVVELRHHRDLEVMIGQYKRPFARERITSSGRLSLVDRSIVDSALTLDRDLGFDLRSRDAFGMGWLRYYAGVSAGEGRDGGVGGDYGLLYFVRLEVLPLGLFHDHTQADLERGPPRLSIGAAYAFHHRGRGVSDVNEGAPLDGGTTNSHHAAADVLFMARGFTFISEFLMRYGRRTPGDAVDEMGDPLPVTAPSNGVGWFAQAGVLMPEIPLELAVRFGLNRPLGAPAETSFVGAGELGGGLSYYFEGHALTLGADYFRLFADDLGVGADRVRVQLEGVL